MSTYKQFLASDVIVTPLKVNKAFSLPYSEWATGSDYQLTGIDRFEGVKGSFLTNKSTTGTLTSEYKVLVYESIKELYYTNHLSSSYNSPLIGNTASAQTDNAQTSSLIPGNDPQGDVFVGSTDSVGRYYNYPQTTLEVIGNYGNSGLTGLYVNSKYLATGSGATVGVLSIPLKLYGNYIEPKTFSYKVNIDGNYYTVQDDGEGNIEYNNMVVGNIFYSHGIVTFTAGGASGSQGLVFGGYGVSIYGDSNDPYGEENYINFISGALYGTDVTCSFSSSLTFYETQYKCTLRENEFNFSLNPSIISGSTDGTIYDFATSSVFAPYVTTIGLYDDNQDLLALGKLAQPIPSSATTDTTIFINIDR